MFETTAEGCCLHQGQGLHLLIRHVEEGGSHGGAHAHGEDRGSDQAAQRAHGQIMQAAEQGKAAGDSADVHNADASTHRRLKQSTDLADRRVGPVHKVLGPGRTGRCQVLRGCELGESSRRDVSGRAGTLPNRPLPGSFESRVHGRPVVAWFLAVRGLSKQEPFVGKVAYLHTSRAHRLAAFGFQSQRPLSTVAESTLMLHFSNHVAVGYARRASAVCVYATRGECVGDVCAVSRHDRVSVAVRVFCCNGDNPYQSIKLRGERFLRCELHIDRERSALRSDTPAANQSAPS